MSSGITSLSSVAFFLPLISILAYIIVIVVTLDSIWRVEKRLDSFLKLLLTGFIIITVRMVLGIIGLSGSSNWLLITRIGDFLSGVFFLSALIIMFKIVRTLNSEKR